ncbi:Alpha/Beta hydrolase protein [Zychaea mexicana]|uniref:Alpha/Beta hydrolase protein n=1 Tax=Zychaea mexicana TaxID=64656 RepID=UPI0022FE1DDD|nr:Alpha/Beta hydrolase protein [Zychaea mexicana]KAI9496277.1 Alpha/Beta hydrolase protein [Zychaea mexicana]
MTVSLNDEYKRLHPVYVAAAKAFAANPPNHENIPLPQLRAAIDGQCLQLRGTVPKVAVEDKMVPYSMDNNKEVQVRIVRPPGTEAKDLPGVIFLHGGGWIFGDKDTYLKTTADLAIRTQTVVIYVEYAKSPEAQYPKALEQAFGVARWLHTHGGSIHVHADQLATCGDSAGGNLATAVCLLAKKRGYADMIKTQILLYPTVSGSHEQRSELESVQRFGSTNDFGLSWSHVDLALNAYCGTTEVTTTTTTTIKQDDIKLIAPLSASAQELQGLPPCLMILAECDVVRTEGELYANKLMSAGVETVAIQILGTIHGFFQMPLPIDTPQYHKTMSMIAAHLTDVFFSARK